MSSRNRFRPEGKCGAFPLAVTIKELSAACGLSVSTVRKALNFVLADKVAKVLEPALAHKDAENKPEVIMQVSGKKSRPGIRQ